MYSEKKKKTSENIFLLLLSPVEEKHLVLSAERLFSERSRFLQREGFTQNELLLIAIKLRQSTAEETKSCPLDPIQSKPVLTPAAP